MNPADRVRLQHMLEAARDAQSFANGRTREELAAEPFLLLQDGRRREGIRLLHRLLVEAEDHRDSETAADARHELSWLTDEDEPARAGTTGGEQLVFDLRNSQG